MFIRKGDIFFSQKDLWDFDQTLAKIIHAGLVQFKASCHYQSAPKAFIDVLPFQADSIQRTWELALDQMIYAFSPRQYYEQIEPMLMDYETIYADHIDLDHVEHLSMQVVAKPHAGFSQADIEAYQQREAAWYAEDEQKRRQGLRLFTDYFHYLWQA